jgi:hypothetical protein
MKSTMPVKTADIVVRGVNDFLDGDICQNVSEWSEVMKRYRIDDVDFVTRGDLNETELLGIMVETVGFCVKGNGMSADQLTSDDTELSGPTNDLDRKR